MKTHISFLYSYDEGSIDIESKENLEIEISKKTGIYNENTRGICFKAHNKEQAERWYKVFTDNPDLAKSLIF